MGKVFLNQWEHASELGKALCAQLFGLTVEQAEKIMAARRAEEEKAPDSIDQ
jgi:hypothetical protein